MSESRIYIITGMSGAGKSFVVRTLEDLSFFCVDNLPPALIPKFAELCSQTENKVNNIALVIDSRGGKFFKELVGVLDELSASGYNYKLLFLDAEDDVLIRRFKETRRRHPLGKDKSITEAIAEERQMMSALKTRANYIFDTSELATSELKRKVIEIFNDDEFPTMNVLVESFGFKYGTPRECDMMFDVRFLPNPFYDPKLRPLTGNDQEVIDYIAPYKVTTDLLEKLRDLINFLLPQYLNEGKSSLNIGIGCTGGQHRSVFIANQVLKMVESQGYSARVLHRDIDKKIQR